jgi:hypothetical protein
MFYKGDIEMKGWKTMQKWKNFSVLENEVSAESARLGFSVLENIFHFGRVCQNIVIAILTKNQDFK